MGDIVLLSTPIDLNTDTGHQFIVDCTRAGEGLLSDKELQQKYELSPADWQNITKDTALGRAIRAERERRMLNGVAARESAAKFFVKGPSILDQIATDSNSNARHKIDALRELRATAAVGSSADHPRETERFVIRIDLTAGGGEVETYDRTIDIKVNGDDNGSPQDRKLDDQW